MRMSAVIYCGLSGAAFTGFRRKIDCFGGGGDTADAPTYEHKDRLQTIGYIYQQHPRRLICESNEKTLKRTTTKQAYIDQNCPSVLPSPILLLPELPLWIAPTMPSM